MITISTIIITIRRRRRRRRERRRTMIITITITITVYNHPVSEEGIRKYESLTIKSS